MDTAKMTGFASGIVDILLLQSYVQDIDTITRVMLYSLSAAVVTVLTTKSVAAITRLTELPSKEEWEKFGHRLDAVSNKLDLHLAVFDEWKSHIDVSKGK